MNSRVFVSFFLIGTTIMIGVMRWHGKPLTKTVSKKGIVSLELAKTKQRADEITVAWKGYHLQQHAITNTYIDFIFIFFYSFFLFGSNWILSAKQTGFLKNTSQLIALFGLATGLADITENFFLLKMLALNISNAEANFTWWLAVIKFSLAGISSLWIPIQLLLLYIRKPEISFV